MVPLIVASAVALVAGGTGRALSGAPALITINFGQNPTLDVLTSESSGGLAVAILTSGSSGPVPPAKVAIDLAPGYTLPPAAPGTALGVALLASSSSGDTSMPGAFAEISGAITADDPSHYANDPASLACAPGPYSAVWKLTSSIFGLSVVMPIFVEHPAASPQAVELRFCAPTLTGADGQPVTSGSVPLQSATFIVGGLTAPTGTGNLTSSAYVTPQTSAGGPDTASTVEARFVQPRPHILTAKGRYDAKTHDAVLTGKVTENGRPQARAVVEFDRAHVLVLPRSVRTTAAGTFTIHARITGSTRFDLDVPDETGACAGASSAPKGCASLTTAGTNSKTVLVRP